MARDPGCASFQFQGELNDHLPPELREREIEKSIFLPASAKDMIESQGVPHTEVDLILVNGEASNFSRLIQKGDRVEVFPAGAALAIAETLHLQPEPLPNPKFVLDVHLGRLAGYLRMLGFDAEYAKDATDPELVRISSEQERILLTRDRGVLKHSAVTHGYWLRETDSRRQTAEVVKRFRLEPLFRPFSRCMVCNEPLRPVAKEDVAARVPPDTWQTCEAFRECSDCRRVYWEGSHARRMRRWIGELSGASAHQGAT